jgi:hypothetical protein
VSGLFYFPSQEFEVFCLSRSVLALTQIMWLFLPGDYRFGAAMMNTISTEGKDERSHFAGLVDRELLDFVRRLFAQLVPNRLGLTPSQAMSFNTGGYGPAGIFFKD